MFSDHLLRQPHRGLVLPEKIKPERDLVQADHSTQAARIEIDISFESCNSLLRTS